MPIRTIEITYRYSERFFAIEDGKCYALAYPLNPVHAQKKAAANV